MERSLISLSSTEEKYMKPTDLHIDLKMFSELVLVQNKKLYTNSQNLIVKNNKKRLITGWDINIVNNTNFILRLFKYEPLIEKSFPNISFGRMCDGIPGLCIPFEELGPGECINIEGGLINPLFKKKAIGVCDKSGYVLIIKIDTMFDTVITNEHIEHALKLCILPKSRTTEGINDLFEGLKCLNNFLDENESSKLFYLGASPALIGIR